ncbi:hypothetical protein D3C80_1499270 [compost metagenome]
MGSNLAGAGGHQIEACFKVTTGTECLVPGAGNDGDQSAWIIPKVRPGFHQLQVGSRPDAVALFRAVEANDTYRAVCFVFNFRKGHNG